VSGALRIPRSYGSPVPRTADRCPECGPSLWFWSQNGGRVDGTDAALAATQRALAAGAVIAGQGNRRLHLACRVDDEAAVGTLRARKMRGAKPFAMLVRDLGVARRYAGIDDAEAGVLSSAARPIVLLRRHAGRAALRPWPGSPLLGLMLPYSHPSLLLCNPSPGPVPDALVLTSANHSDEPLCFTDEDAALRLPRAL